MNPIEIGKRLKKARIDNKLTLDALALKVKVDIGTISRVERGMPVKEDTLEKLTSYFNIVIDETETTNEKTLLIGYGPLLWSSPVVMLAFQNEIPRGIQMAYSYRTDQPQSSSEKPSFENQALEADKVIGFTAKELISLLENKILNVVFLPQETIKYNTNICRIGSVMNTIKNGVQILALSASETEKITSTVIDDLRGKGRLIILYHEGTIGDEVYKRFFLNEARDFVPIRQLQDFSFLSSKKLEEYLKHKKIVLYFGWDFNLYYTKLQQIETSDSTKKYNLNIIDSYELTPKDDQIYKVSYDFVTLWEHLENPNFVKKLQVFCQVLEKKINLLREEKQYDENPYLKKIVQYIGILKKDDLHKNLEKEILKEAKSSLRKTNFELMFYPEFVNLLINIKIR